ncbi:hypothetical protein GCM10027169_14020 [Gordonia jinhuaensis]|uniref:Uncharacterized protein n=1 Tax=Gordonia jinhuaensis TaxID=1517702 RepID=A0A916T0S4_9ACTN|nr:hypothetical protein GCM10011489_09360 [Gordonia jinhuaensis]
MSVTAIRAASGAPASGADGARQERATLRAGSAMLTSANFVGISLTELSVAGMSLEPPPHAARAVTAALTQSSDTP